MRQSATQITVTNGWLPMIAGSLVAESKAPETTERASVNLSGVCRVILLAEAVIAVLDVRF